jgi:TLC domain
MSLFSLIGAYWSFINRPPPSIIVPHGISAIPNVYQSTFIYCILFSIIYAIIPIICTKYYKEWYNNLDKRKRIELPTYIVCLVHHSYVVPRSMWRIYQDSLLNASQAAIVNYAANEINIVPFNFGFFIADSLWIALPDLILRGKSEIIMHHIFTLGLGYTGLYAPGEYSRFIPHLGLTELSNTFFNAAWLLRAIGYRDTAIVTTLEILFAVSYFFTRVINLTAVFYAIYSGPSAASIGIGKYLMFPMTLLQFYWFFLIVKGLIKRLKKSKDD